MLYFCKWKPKEFTIWLRIHKKKKKVVVFIYYVSFVHHCLPFIHTFYFMRNENVVLLPVHTPVFFAAFSFLFHVFSISVPNLKTLLSLSTFTSLDFFQPIPAHLSDLHFQNPVLVISQIQTLFHLFHEFQNAHLFLTRNAIL